MKTCDAGTEGCRETFWRLDTKDGTTTCSGCGKELKIVIIKEGERPACLKPRKENEPQKTDS